MNIISFLLPLTFATLLAAAPDKSQKDIVKKTSNWKSWKQEARKEAQRDIIIPAQVRLTSSNFQQGQLAAMFYAAQVQSGKLQKIENATHAQIMQELRVLVDTEKVEALTDDLSNLDCK